MEERSTKNLLSEIVDLKDRLSEAEQLIDAIKAGEVDAFALNKNNKSEIFTLESGDYAYRMLIENFNEGALNLTEDGLIVYTNTYFHNLIALPYEKVISTSVFDFIDPESVEAFKDIFKKGLEGQSKGEINLASGNKTIPVYVSLTSLYPRLQTVGMIVTDLTEKIKSAKLLKQSEENIKAKAEQLEENNSALEKMNKELQSFAYISSHDLQEPLRKIQIFSSRILEREFQNLTENGKDSFTRMQLAAKRMQTLIEDLLAYTRTNAGERIFEDTDLNKIFEEVKEELKEEIQAKNATVEAFELCHVNIIAFQFRQLMNNLIGNSLKFSKPGQPLHIKIECEIEKGIKLGNDKLVPHIEYCHISFSDNGIGFEPQYSEKIFEVFQRLHGKTEYQGTGIGLSIVKKIVENHAGLITAQSEIGKGAKFDIFIPVS